MSRRTGTFLVAAVMATVPTGIAAVATVANAATGPICEQFGSTHQGGYVVMNNRWNPAATGQQCIDVTADGFTISKQPNSVPTNGGPASYPAIYLGCHYANCSENSPLPEQLTSIGSAVSSITYNYGGSGTYDAAYDIWLDSTPKRDGVNQTEIMIWFNHVGPIQPVGSKTGTAAVGGRGWDVWTGNNGQNNVVSYVAGSAITTWSFDTLAFIRDALTRGSQYGTLSWYLTSVQAGFEPWSGGEGLAITSFDVSVNGGTPPTSPPPTTAPPPGNGGCFADYRTVNSWPGGFQGEIAVHNNGAAIVDGWTVAFSLPDNQTITRSWNTTLTSNGSTYTARPADYNSTVAPGGGATFGFIANGSPGTTSPTCATR